MSSHDQTSERGQGPASVPGNSGSAQSQSKREGPSLEEIKAALRQIRPRLIKLRDGTLTGLGMDGVDEAAADLQALFSTVGSDSRVRELEEGLNDALVLGRLRWGNLDPDANLVFERCAALLSQPSPTDGETDA